LIAKQQEEEKKRLEFEENVKGMEQQIRDLELEIARGASGSEKGYKDTPEYKSLQKWVQQGEKGMDIEEIKTLRTDNDTSGGYWTMTEMDTMIIKSITEISPVRQVARVKSVSKKTLEIPKRTGIPTATYEGEAAAGGSDESTYGSEQLTTYRLTVTVPYTLDLLGDSEFDLEAEIKQDVAEAFAYTEGNKFVLGTGAKQPEGLLINAAVVANARTSSTSGTIDPDDLILLTGDLKVGYNPMYAFNRGTLAFFRSLKGTDNHYLWQAGLGPNVPNTLNGEPYMVFQDMPAIAAGSLSVIYGDFLRGYTITDRTGLVIVRDEYTQKKNAIVEMTFHRWNHGQVVLSEAFKVLKTKT